ncbi:MAG: hypothetical protein JO076_13215 [Verrucomicrobia bacterium]|nr:hypothetical protein [Verrucomicrobiota bacterium]
MHLPTKTYISTTSAGTAQAADERLLQEVQLRAFRFFWEQAHPDTGLVNDRANNFGVTDYTVASISTTGYGLSALPIGVEHGWLKRTEAVERARTTMRFLLTMPNRRGWMIHFVDRRTGERAWQSEHSSIDTALLLAGALVCGQYFARDPSTRDIADSANTLYRRLDWWWLLTNDGRQPEKRVLSHGWTPENGFIMHSYADYSEALLMYLLGLGAPMEPLPPAAWEAFERPIIVYQGIESLKAGPIFIHQMPSGYFCFRQQRDRFGFDYWVASTNAMKIHRQFCLDNAGNRQTYAKGFWGLNASDGPDGYVAYGAPDGPQDGTVSPTGAICSITFTPELGLSAVRALHERPGSLLWGRYGFVNAFNIDRNWYGSDVIGIDLGMALLAIENYRTGLIWALMDSAGSTSQAFQSAGFRPTVEPEPRLLRRSDRTVDHRT